MPVSVESFLKHLANSGILSPDELLQIQKQVPRDKLQEDAQELAKELARQKKLFNPVRGGEMTPPVPLFLFSYGTRLAVMRIGQS